MSHEMNSLVESVVKKVLSDNSDFQTKPKTEYSKMSLALAKKLILAVEQKAKELGVNAVVAITDAGANIVAVECMDNSYIASYDIAVNKAYTCVALKMTTKKLSSLAAPGGSLYGIQHTNNGKIVIFGGGEPLRFGSNIIGGLGVSGGTEEQDTYLASYGRTLFETSKI